MNYYNHHIGDFDRATRHLTRIERSIYRDLLDVYYDTEQPLTLDLPALCRKIIARTNEEVTAVEQTLNEFFTKTPTGWYHARCEEELDAYRTSTSQKSIAGKASAAKRAEKRQRALDGIPTDVERPSNGTPTNQEPITNNQIETPLPPSGGIRASTRKMQTTLQGFIDDCKAKDERPLRDYKPLWDYASGVGLNVDYVALAWAEFCRRCLPGGVEQTKKQKDWRQTFRNFIEKNYLKLWAIDKDGNYFLTTAGKQAQQFQNTKQLQDDKGME